jgi:anti-sigma B factor antagonist
MQVNPLQVTVDQVQGCPVVHVRGDVMAVSIDPLRQAIAGAIATKPARLVIDLTGATFLSSPGLAVLVQAMQLLQRGGGKLVLAGANDRVRGIFEIARLTDVFTMVPTLDAAFAG